MHSYRIIKQKRGGRGCSRLEVDLGPFLFFFLLQFIPGNRFRGVTAGTLCTLGLLVSPWGSESSSQTWGRDLTRGSKCGSTTVISCRLEVGGCRLSVSNAARQRLRFWTVFCFFFRQWKLIVQNNVNNNSLCKARWNGGPQLPEVQCLAKEFHIFTSVTDFHVFSWDVTEQDVACDCEEIEKWCSLTLIQCIILKLALKNDDSLAKHCLLYSSSH